MQFNAGLINLRKILAIINIILFHPNYVYQNYFGSSQLYIHADQYFFGLFILSGEPRGLCCNPLESENRIFPSSFQTKWVIIIVLELLEAHNYIYYSMFQLQVPLILVGITSFPPFFNCGKKWRKNVSCGEMFVRKINSCGENLSPVLFTNCTISI